jgi:hypothetical protein
MEMFWTFKMSFNVAVLVYYHYLQTALGAFF